MGAVWNKKDKVAISAANAAYYQANKEKIKARKRGEKERAARRAYREANRDLMNERTKIWYRANREEIAARTAERRRIKSAEARRNRIAIPKEKRESRAARAQKRKTAQRQATPWWLTPAQRREILAMYTLAEAAGIAHVDHIVPLISETVCGLHVPSNLRVVVDKDNLRKHNLELEPNYGYTTEVAALACEAWRAARAQGQ